ncbi:Ti-type conjugative transfer relaxase TraA [Aquicella lusitana]|uniref:Plasmid mobilization system relaxase n=1 Tax=Aquicella lusitana TaxID=254246 RepID=A0A370G4M4_9COXI|nr:Ti-type conjugative transfer relaxase TraA [Aquicella lusitana]RDI37986.1 plasmid mobilization system relaxase [Aquicella lusitana]VVC74725.1 Mobilization protein A [Aquicella lusitana]
MAIYHFSGTVISRSQGRSAVACAAYRSAEKLHDEKYDREHDYTHKQDVSSTEILLPENAPAWMADREKLWNAVESHEKRKDAQLAREFNFALPRELTLEQNIALAKDFVKEAFVRKGMVADFCIHNDKQHDGQFHPHAHVMLTMREVTQDGFGQKVRAWNDKAMLLNWREEWAEVANKHLALHGHDLRIDHRTLGEQGIALEPQHKIGATVARDRLVRMEDHQRIARENGDKLLADPSVALNAITRQQSTFTHQDIARFVHRHTVDAEQFSLVYEKVKSHESLVRLGIDEKDRERFTTNEMLSLESKMMERAVNLSKSDSHVVSDTHQEKALSQKSLTVEQKTAFDHLVGGGDLKCVVGFAGTGKSYLLGAAKDAWEKEGYAVHGVTLSGIAAENLEGSSGIDSRTFASRCYYWDKGEQLLTKKDVLVVDEAGMLSSRQMARLMEEASRGGAKVVLVGDPQQLQAIEAGAAFRAIAEQVHYVELTDIRRQSEKWQQDATKELATGKTTDAINRYDQHFHVHDFETKAVAKVALTEVWNDARLSNTDKTQIMLAYNRDDVLELNQIARGLRHKQGELGKDVLFQTERGERAFAERDRVYFLKNDKSLGVMNGTLGTIEAIKDGAITVRLDGDGRTNVDRRVTVTMERYNQLDYGYAATIHKAQGVTVDRSYVLASKYLDAHSTYVAMSRHRESADLFYGRDVFLNKDDLVKTLSRERTKDVTLDYLNSRDRRQEPVTRVMDEIKPLTRDEERLMRQAKLKEFTEATKAKRGIDLDRSVDSLSGTKQRPDLSEFKRQFEAKNPERASALRSEVMPEHEKKALSLVNEFKRLEAIVDKGGRTSRMAQDHLEKLADKISRQKDVMQYVREHHAPMEKQIDKQAREFQRDRGLELER